MKKYKNGFTLIELMITVAIIGILSALAVVSYQSYVVKTQLKSAFIELKGATAHYDLIMLDALNGSFTVASIGFSPSNICTYSVYAPVNGIATPALECKLKNVASAIENKFIYLNKIQDGGWGCSTSNDIPANLKPIGCV